MQDLIQGKTQECIREIGLEQALTAAIGHVDRNGDVRYDWHEHPHHQLLYSARGTAQVEAQARRYFLPPQRAIWISAGATHRTTLVDCTGVSVYFPTSLIDWEPEPVRVIAAVAAVPVLAASRPRCRTAAIVRRRFGTANRN